MRVNLIVVACFIASVSTFAISVPILENSTGSTVKIYDDKIPVEVKPVKLEVKVSPKKVDVKLTGTSSTTQTAVTTEQTVAMTETTDAEITTTVTQEQTQTEKIQIAGNEKNVKPNASTASTVVKSNAESKANLVETKQSVKEVKQTTTKKPLHQGRGKARFQFGSQYELKTKSDDKIQKPLGKVSETATEKSTERSTEKNIEKVTDKATEKVTEKVTVKTTEKPIEKTTKFAVKATEKTTAKATEKVTQKTTEIATGKTTEKLSEKPTEKPIPGKKVDNVKEAPVENESEQQQMVTTAELKNVENESNANVMGRANILTPDVRRKGKKYHDIQIIKLESELAEDGKYNYIFESDDGTLVNQEGELKKMKMKNEYGEEMEEQMGEAVKGSYSYKDDDGKTYSVTYTADENGYRPVGEHIPKIPPAIVRSLAWSATAKPWVDPWLVQQKKLKAARAAKKLEMEMKSTKKPELEEQKEETKEEMDKKE